MKKTISIKGNKLNQLISEAVIKVLNENKPKNRRMTNEKRNFKNHIILKEGYGDTATPEEVAEQFSQMRYHSFTAPDESCEIGFEYDPQTNQLYAGYIFNAGINHEWVIDYNLDGTVDDNLQNLYDVICEEGDWEYPEE